MAIKKLSKALTEMWPGLKEWPENIGPPPNADNIRDSAVIAEKGSAVQMAIAMGLRTIGASDSEGAIAATAATGAKSDTHRNKRDTNVKAGVLVEKMMEKRGGHKVRQISLSHKTLARVATTIAPKLKTKKAGKKVRKPKTPAIMDVSVKPEQGQNTA